MRKLVLGALIWASSAFAADSKHAYQVDVPESVFMSGLKYGCEDNVRYLVCWLVGEGIDDGSTVNGYSSQYFFGGLHTYKDDRSCGLFGDVQGARYATLDTRFKIACGFLETVVGVKWVQEVRTLVQDDSHEDAKKYQAMVSAWNLCQLDYDSDDDDFSRYYDCE